MSIVREVVAAQGLRSRAFGESVMTSLPENSLEASASAPPSTFSDERTRASLLAGIRSGNESSWAKLVDRYSPLVYGMCRKSGVPADDAADILQDTFRSVLRSFPQFRRERPGDGFRPWLRTIVANKIRDYFRTHRHRARAVGGTTAQQRIEAVADPIADDSSLSNIAASFTLHEALKQVECQFEPQVWQAFWMTVVEQRPTEAVSEAIGMTPNAIRQARFRVLRKLRDELGEFEDFR